ncbi:MAG: hypothetical protein Q8M70_04170 [bacterium]|nr:hypothetical protein [bacterium]
MNRKLAKFGVSYASMKLGISGIEVHYESESFFLSNDISAVFLKEGYSIVFNQDWLDAANEIEVLICSFHETRHAYQWACIDLPKVYSSDPGIVSVWKKEFGEYRPPGNIEYITQSIESDACKYSDFLLKQFIHEYNLDDNQTSKVE